MNILSGEKPGQVVLDLHLMPKALKVHVCMQFFSNDPQKSLAPSVTLDASSYCLPYDFMLARRASEHFSVVRGDVSPKSFDFSQM